MTGGSAKKIKCMGGVGEKIKCVGGGRPRFFPVRPPLRISNGIALKSHENLFPNFNIINLPSIIGTLHWIMVSDIGFGSFFIKANFFMLIWIDNIDFSILSSCYLLMPCVFYKSRLVSTHVQCWKIPDTINLCQTIEKYQRELHINQSITIYQHFIIWLWPHQHHYLPHYAEEIVD